DRVYAMFETGDGVPWKGQETEVGQLWRSDDGGGQWKMISADRSFMGRAHYYSHIEVAPDNPDETYALTASYGVSVDGGVTLREAALGSSPGGDNHEIWIDPTQPTRHIIGNDSGVSISVNRGRSWERIRLPNA